MKFALAVIGLVVFLFLFSYFDVISFKQEKEFIDCSQPLTPFFLLQSEEKYASEIVNEIHGFVVIINEDKTRKLIARNEINKCIGFSELMQYVLK